MLRMIANWLIKDFRIRTINAINRIHESQIDLDKRVCQLSRIDRLVDPDYEDTELHQLREEVRQLRRMIGKLVPVEER